MLAKIVGNLRLGDCAAQPRRLTDGRGDHPIDNASRCCLDIALPRWARYSAGVSSSGCSALPSILEGVLRYLSEHEALDTDIRIATFDNYTILDCLPIPIDSVEQDYVEMSRHLFSCMQSLLNKETLVEPQKVYPAKIHFRRC